MILPPALTPESTIGIVSPSYWLESKIIHKTVSIFIEKGYKIIQGKSVSLKDGPFSGSPQERADDIIDMFANPEIDAIICARGGYGANRVLPLLDYSIIKANPKIFMGYSDITSFLISITQKTGLVTFHGPMLTSYKNGLVNYNFDLMESVLSGNQTSPILPPKDLPSRILKQGTAHGPLWGGNMTLLMNRLGTPDQLKTDGCILFIEDIDEYLYSLDRMLVHMRTAGMFDKILGLIIGELVDVKDEKIPFGKTTDEIILNVCDDLDIPIMANFPCGHGKYQATLPISLPVRLELDERKVELTLLETSINYDFKYRMGKELNG
ncbi:MAG: LD-carboxypeptidase [Fidelibacterota bacterium]